MSIIISSMEYISQVIFPIRFTRKLSNSGISNGFLNFFMGNSAWKIFQAKTSKAIVYNIELWNRGLSICSILEQTQNCFLRKIFVMSTVLSRPSLCRCEPVLTQGKVYQDKLWVRHLKIHKGTFTFILCSVDFFKQIIC